MSALRLVGLALFAAGMTAGFATAAAQPQVPSTFYGSATVDGEPVPDGTPVRAFVGGKDCTQGGGDALGTVLDGGVSAYTIHVMHETQEPGCGTEGATVTFTVGGREADQTGTWKPGPQRLDLNAGSGDPRPLPTATPTSTPEPTTVAATATEEARYTPIPATALPTDEVEPPFAGRTATRDTGAGGARGQSPGSGGSDGGGFPILAGLAIVLGVILLAGTGVGVALSRRTPSSDIPGSTGGEPRA